MAGWVGRLGRQCRGEVKRRGRRAPGAGEMRGKEGGWCEKVWGTALAGWVPEVKALAGGGNKERVMQRLFCTCAFFLAAASVAALGADRAGSNAAEFAVLCGAYRAAKAVQDSAEQCAPESKALKQLEERDMWSKRQEDQEAVTALARSGRRRRANTKPKGLQTV
ncbi:hypothetical protein ERJ75_000899500 [Trypanosoma vivax]|nr:hypothetical protein ERJ75_000899500 [Trypanosoma vivax]